MSLEQNIKDELFAISDIYSYIKKDIKDTKDTLLSYLEKETVSELRKAYLTALEDVL